METLASFIHCFPSLFPFLMDTNLNSDIPLKPNHDAVGKMPDPPGGIDFVFCFIKTHSNASGSMSTH
jgi:hypothetical protein